MVNDNYSKVVSRNYTDQNQVSDAGLPRSGQDMSYTSDSSGVIGRLIPCGYQHLMPGSKYSGSTQINLQLDQMTTPLAPNMLLRVHNFFVPYFCVNKDFRDIMTANPSNNFNKNKSIGAFNPVSLASIFGNKFFPNWITLFQVIGNPSSNLSSLKPLIPSNVTDVVPITLSDNNAASVYVTGAIADLRAQVQSRMIDDVVDDTPSVVRQYLYSVYSPVIHFFFGEGSLLDEFGYPYISDTILRSFFLNGNSIFSTALPNLQDYFSYLFYNHAYSDAFPFFNDFALRAYHAVWIEFYRNVQLQKLTDDLDYHNWDNTYSLNDGNNYYWMLFMLTKHICPWNEDLFTSAQTDDIMRRVFMPVVSSAPYATEGSTNIEYNKDNTAVSRFLTLQQISYLDDKGVNKNVTLPVPSILNSSIHALTYDTELSNGSGFDLFSLKRAQMLERFLKRGHYFGSDEYRDIIKGQYGVDISDLRINRPQFLGGDTSFIQLNQHVSTAGSTPTQEIGQDSGSFGQRIVTGNGQVTGNTFTDFSEEWGIVITMFSIIPDVQYDPLCVQNTQIRVQDYPIPVLCQNFEAVIPTMALSRNTYYDPSNQDFGHAPSAYQYRSRVNEVHGRFLDEFSDYTCARFFGNSEETTPKLNSSFLECRPYLGCFVNKILLDGQFIYTANHQFFVENPLPAPVEVI